MGYEFVREKVESLLYDRKILKKDASKALNIDPKSLRRKMDGKHDFTVTEIALLANLLKVDPGLFFTFKSREN